MSTAGPSVLDFTDSGAIPSDSRPTWPCFAGTSGRKLTEFAPNVADLDPVDSTQSLAELHRLLADAEMSSPHRSNSAQVGPESVEFAPNLGDSAPSWPMLFDAVRNLRRTNPATMDPNSSAKSGRTGLRNLGAVGTDPAKLDPNAAKFGRSRPDVARSG